MALLLTGCLSEGALYAEKNNNKQTGSHKSRLLVTNCGKSTGITTGGHSEPIVTGVLIGAKKCREARGSYFV